MPVSKDNNNMVAKLKHHGLQPIGNWVASDNHASVAHLRESCKSGIHFELQPEWKKQRNVVYAFVVDGYVQYVGETTAGMASRFASYRYGNPLESDTDNRVKLAITEALEFNRTVEIWAAHPTAEYRLPNGEILAVPASKPLEEHLICVLRPNLNVKNLAGSESV